ncbi:hypothetical protein NL676_025885 [Syzygium grande]|nr:hypothetical protein NL676_025885 [Syzygium grande]
MGGVEEEEEEESEMRDRGKALGVWRETGVGGVRAEGVELETGPRDLPALSDLPAPLSLSHRPQITTIPKLSTAQHDFEPE